MNPSRVRHFPSYTARYLQLTRCNLDDILSLRCVGLENMSSIIKNYGHVLSALVQVVFYYFAAQHLMDEYLRLENSFINSVMPMLLIVGPLVVTKYFETKYAQRFMGNDEA